MLKLLFFTGSSCKGVEVAGQSFSVRSEDDPILTGGDIAVDSEAEKNADPCTSRGCMWGKYTDGKVYIPYYIASHFCEYDVDFLRLKHSTRLQQL